MATSVTPSRDSERYRRPYLVQNDAPAPRILSRAPQTPFAVVGTVEVRTSRPKSGEDLAEELINSAIQLDADALIPPVGKEASQLHASFNPLRPYYVFDDGRVQILEAQAIRFPTVPR